MTRGFLVCFIGLVLWWWSYEFSKGQKSLCRWTRWKSKVKTWHDKQDFSMLWLHVLSERKTDFILRLLMAASWLRPYYNNSFRVPAAAWIVKAAIEMCFFTSFQAERGSALFSISNIESKMPGNDSPAYLLWLLGAKMICLVEKNKEDRLNWSVYIYYILYAFSLFILLC